MYNSGALDLNAGVTPMSGASASLAGAYFTTQNAASYRVVSCCVKVTFTGNIANN